MPRALAVEPPIVVVTTNRTREIHDALKRRCLYHWVDYPDAEREMAILHARAPEAADTLSREDSSETRPPRYARTSGLVRHNAIRETLPKTFLQAHSIHLLACVT